MPSKYFRDLSIYADKGIVEVFKGGFVQRFHRQTCCISEHYRTKLSGKLLTNGTAKVLLEFVADSSTIKPALRPGPDTDVLIRQLRFDFAPYLNDSALGKKHRVESALYDCLTSIAVEGNWNRSLIDEVHKEVIDNDFIFTGISKASWPGPDSKYRVRIAFDWDLDAIGLFAVLFRNRSSVEVSRKKLGELVPESGILSEAICQQHGRWASNTEFELKTTDFLLKRMKVSFVDEM